MPNNLVEALCWKVPEQPTPDNKIFIADKPSVMPLQILSGAPDNVTGTRHSRKASAVLDNLNESLERKFALIYNGTP